MSIVRFHAASPTSEKYDESLRPLEEAGEFPPDGLGYNVGFGSHNIVRR